MNKDQLEGKWDEFTAKVKQEWGDLTDDEVRQTEGNLEELQAKIQQKYGETRDVVAEKVNNIIERMKQ
ncbi:MAG: CsbD family protein [Algiphilus sp.]|uniref:CsbD family protein n=1 Tax=Algiphilus sp. TaxID=1872431 RepID=UPI001CA6BD55|nr:CsbD family protein [Algiphilus sp.]MBY8967031.1 CsbD family protein [Algiphilus acroporae]MCI5063113.1 CsbD family protein [Algiphilus sp.]MCI5103617.1 CsbD family protein [Algiphilus sp.]